MTPGLQRFQQLVPPTQRWTRNRCAFEVLAFDNQKDWEDSTSEAAIKKHIRGKFCSFKDASFFAEYLLKSAYSIVVLRV